MTGQAGTHYHDRTRSRANGCAGRGCNVQEDNALTITDYIESGIVRIIRTDRACVRYHTNSATVTVMYRDDGELQAGLEIAARILEC